MTDYTFKSSTDAQDAIADCHAFCESTFQEIQGFNPPTLVDLAQQRVMLLEIQSSVNRLVNRIGNTKIAAYVDVEVD